MSHKMLGKISDAYVGVSGYQDAMLGIFLSFSSDGWGCGSEKSTWDCSTVECSPNAKWTEADRSKTHDEIMRYISKLLKDAKVSKVEQLKGKPVEIETDAPAFGTIVSWRILTEVL